jgi:hypothetical protein
MGDPALVKCRGDFGKTQRGRPAKTGVSDAFDKAPLPRQVVGVETLGDGSFQALVVETGEHARVADRRFLKWLGKHLGKNVGPALSAADEDSLPSSFAGHLRYLLTHTVQKALRPVLFAGLAVFAHRGVELPGRAASDLARAFVRGLYVFLRQLAQEVQVSEPPLQQPAILTRHQCDSGGLAFVEQFQQRMDEGSLVEHDAVGHWHLAVQLEGPVVV